MRRLKGFEPQKAQRRQRGSRESDRVESGIFNYPHRATNTAAATVRAIAYALYNLYVLFVAGDRANLDLRKKQ
ncbi:MAG TPA: hypothetical protein DCY88_34275 [Cyanobacteria bacterium UBA11372]|nr:hypothetical protein [Cyanobacteria bacterium UBA11372]